VKPVPPFIPGHEGAGYVAALGPGVTSLKEGDPVGIAWLHDSCGACEHCMTGWETLCEAQHVCGAFSRRLARRAPGNNNTRTRMKNDAREQLIG
jgi:D-arabinose 1-dehydrogenase-like Zn-dependent alcohol dehydrogenase